MNITTRRRLEAIEQKSKSTRDFDRSPETVRIIGCAIDYCESGLMPSQDDVVAITKQFNASNFDEAIARCREIMARLDEEYL